MTGEILGITLLLALTLFLLRELGWRAAPVFCAVVLLFVISLLHEQISELIGRALSVEESEKYTEHIADMVKILGLSYLYGISSDICTAIGENQIAKVVDVVGRVEILAIALPYFMEIVALSAQMIR